MNKIDSVHVLNPYRPRRIYLKNEKEEYPSIMAYIFNHILGKNRLHYKKLYEFYQKNPTKYTELKQVFDNLELTCRKDIIQKALENAYKVKILDNYNQIQEIKNTVIQSDRFDTELIQDIIKKLCDHYDSKLTEEQKNILFKIYKVHETLIYMLSQGYDIKLFINKNCEEILKILNQTHADPLWEHKKNLFLIFYNNFPMKKSHVLQKVKNCPLVEAEAKNPGQMVYHIRRNYIIKSSLGLPEKKTLNDYINQRIEQEKIKEMIRIYLNDKYKEYKLLNQELINKEWEEYINTEYLKILTDLTFEEKYNLLENYTNITDHSEHHLKFIQELKNQLISNEEEEELRANSNQSQQEIIPESIKEIAFESQTQKKLLQELEMGMESDNDSDEPIDNKLDFLNPDHKGLMLIDSMVYPSISVYVYTKLLQWIEKDKLINIYPLIIQTHPKKKLTVKDFKSLNELEILCKQKYNERKVFYGLKILNALLENILFCDQLLALNTDPIYIIMNDKLLGIDEHGNGENKLGLALQDMRQLLLKKKCTKKKDRFMDQLYTCSSNPIIRNWLEERYKDISKTIKIFSYFFNIHPINCKVVSYIINKFYLPNNAIYLNCQGQNSSRPPLIFIQKIHAEFQNIEYDVKIIQLLWNYISCLCYSVIKLNNGENVNITLKKYRDKLESGEKKSKKLIRKALENVACHFKNFRKDMPVSYYIPSAQVIMGLSSLPRIDLKTKSEKDAMIQYLKNANVNRLNFFAKNKCRQL